MPKRPQQPDTRGWQMGKPSTGAAPALSIPLRFLATGWLSALVGLGLAAANAPALAHADFSAPAVLATVHTFTLGFLTSTVMGMLYQWVPVITGRPLARPGWAHGHFAAWVLALPCFVLGLGQAASWLLALGGILLTIAAALFLAGMARTLRGSDRTLLPVLFVKAGLTYFALTVVLGLVLDAHLVHVAAVSPSRLLALHIVVAVAGWLGLTLWGVSYRLFPMFVVSEVQSQHAGVVLVAMNAAILLGGVGILGVPAALGAAVVLGLGATGLFLADRAQDWHIHRARRPDPGMRLVRVAGGLLVLVALAGVLSLWYPGRLADTLPALVLGVFFAAILGFGQRIWPFMVWTATSRGIDARTVPHLEELWPSDASRVIPWLTAGAIGLLVAGLAFAVVPAIQVGAVLLAAGQSWVGVMGVRMLAVARHRRHPPGSRLQRPPSPSGR